MAKPHDIPAGTRLGSWLICERLGRGAVATVYRAEDTTTGETVAIKALHADPDDGETHQADRLRREIALAKRVRHPGVCRLYELHEEGTTLFVSMEYVAGRSLRTVIEEDGPLHLGVAVPLLRNICTGMAAAHQLGILHRDLKPGNIMVRPNGKPSILDFGYAVAPDVTRITRTGVWVGTLAYAAPELFKNEKASDKSDIYSLGVIFHECLTGALPFSGVTFGEIVSAILYQEPVVPEDVDPRAALIIERAMCREPSERYASIAALAAALADLEIQLASATAHTQSVSQTSDSEAEASVEAPVVDRFLAIRQQLAELSVALARQRRDKGIIPGDHELLDRLEKTAQLELNRGLWSETIDNLRRALDEVRAIAVDGLFVTAKIERFEAALANKQRGELSHCHTLLGRARQALECGDFIAANRALNRAFEVLLAK